MSMRLKTVEFVCSGNQGRSPLAQLMAENHIQDKGIHGLSAASSGTLVEILLGNKHGTTPFEAGRAKWFIELGLKAGVYSGDDKKTAERVVAAEQVDARSPVVIGLTRKAQFVLDAEEEEHRGLAVVKFNLRGSIKTVREQTTVRRGAIAVLGMSEANADAIRDIYSEQNKRPVITTVTGFTTGQGAEPIPDAIGKGGKAYFEMAEVLRDQTRKAVEKAAEGVA